jgi:hypothetical protein
VLKIHVLVDVEFKNFRVAHSIAPKEERLRGEDHGR